MNSPAIESGQIFPHSEIHDVPMRVADELAKGERVIWIGGPARWGLFRATPFALVLIGAYGFLAYLGSGSEFSAWQMLMMLAATQTGGEALILPGLGAGYVLALGLALRDPRTRWTYVVTDRRLITFHNLRKLREADIQRLERLRVLKGLEGRLRDVGDVVWARFDGKHDSRGRGPDHGQHGFRGMRAPEQWHDRLLKWGHALQRMAADDARTFELNVSADATQVSARKGARTLENRRFGFSISIPALWVGRIGLQERAPIRILGMKMPFHRIIRSSNEPLHAPPEIWNFMTVVGRSGMKFSLNMIEGPPVATFETSRNKVAESLVDVEGGWCCGPLSGYRIDYRYLDKFHCRFAMLAGNGFHMLANITLPPDQVDDLLPAINAVFDSIRAI